MVEAKPKEKREKKQITADIGKEKRGMRIASS